MATIPQSNVIKHLGIHLDLKLKWKPFADGPLAL